MKGEYTLEIKGESLAVAEFESFNHGLNEHYDYKIRLQSSVILLLNTDAALKLNAETLQHGVITAYDSDGHVTLSSPWHAEAITKYFRCFVNKSIPELLKQLLPAWLIKFKCEKAHQKIPFAWQCEQTNYDFISGLLKKAGWLCVFTQEADYFSLLVCDDLQKLSKKDAVSLPFVNVAYAVEQASILSFKASYQVLPKRSSVITHDEQHQLHQVSSRSSSSIPGKGEQFIYFNAGTQKQAQEEARLNQLAIDSQRETYEMKTTLLGVSLGGKIKMSQHPEASYNQEYCIIGIKEYGRATGNTYWNQLTVVPATMDYRLAPTASLNNGLYAAVVTRYLPNLNRYEICFDRDENSATVQLPMASYAANETLHLPLSAGARVIVSCIQGCSDTPVMLGCLAAETVNQQQPELYSFITPQNMIWQMNDAKQSIQWEMPDKTQALTVSSVDGIQLNAHEGNFHSESARETSISAKEIKFESGEDCDFRIGQEIKMVAENIGIQSHDDCIQTAENYRLNVTENLTWRLNNRLICTANSMLINAETFQASFKRTTIATEQLALNSQQEILLQSGAASVRLSAEGIQINGSVIRLVTGSVVV